MPRICQLLPSGESGDLAIWVRNMESDIPNIVQLIVGEDAKAFASNWGPAEN